MYYYNKEQKKSTWVLPVPSNENEKTKKIEAKIGKNKKPKKQPASLVSQHSPSDNTGRWTSEEHERFVSALRDVWEGLEEGCFSSQARAFFLHRVWGYR